VAGENHPPTLFSELISKLFKLLFPVALWLNSWALSSLFGYLLAIPVTFSALVSDSLYPFASRPIAMPPFLSHDELLEEGR
jgi:hypothetical protein